jgi:hypothetical protein
MTTTMSMSAPISSVAGAVHDVRRTLSQNLNDELAFTVDNYAPGSTTMQLKAIPRRLGPGSILSWHEATLYVVSVSESSSQIEVLSGYDGGPDIAIPANTPLRVNPRFTDYTLFQSIAAAVTAMASPANGLFGVQVETVTGMKTDDFYPIPSAYASRVLKVLKVSGRSDGSRDWTDVRLSDYIVSLTPGNQHLRIFTDALQYEIVYAVQIAKPTSYDADLITDCHLSESMLDIPALGAASVLMYGQEARRVNQRAQGDPRRSEDVPITGATGAARDLRRAFEQRIDEEHIRQISLYSYKVA